MSVTYYYDKKLKDARTSRTWLVDGLLTVLFIGLVFVLAGIL